MDLDELAITNITHALDPLVGMPLERLEVYLPREGVDGSPVPPVDLSPLADMPLEHIFLYGGNITDLSPLRGAPLRALRLYVTEVTDIGPVVQSDLDVIEVGYTPLSDLRPLVGSRVRLVRMHDLEPEIDVEPLASCPELLWAMVPEDATGVEKLDQVRDVLRAGRRRWIGHPVIPQNAQTGRAPGQAGKE